MHTYTPTHLPRYLGYCLNENIFPMNRIFPFVFQTVGQSAPKRTNKGRQDDGCIRKVSKLVWYEMRSWAGGSATGVWRGWSCAPKGE